MRTIFFIQVLRIVLVQGAKLLINFATVKVVVRRGTVHYGEVREFSTNQNEIFL